MNRIVLRRFSVLGIFCLCLLAAGLALAAESGRSLPFNKQNVFSYFKQVEEEKAQLPEDIAYAELQERQCQIYVRVLKQSGYDFEATVQNAIQFADRGNRKLDDPRFLFLAGVFQMHPDLYLRLKLIAKPTRDAVVSYFGG